MRFTFRRPRIRLAAPLSTITLDDVLSGDTCPPIGLADFEAYLAHKEHSVENLRFVVWYQSYRRRFFALPAAQQGLSPGPRHFSFALPSPARTAQHASRVSSRATAPGYAYDDPASPLSSSAPASPTLSHTTSAPLTGPRGCAHAAPERQPYRAECTLVAATFLLPGAPAELMLPAAVQSAMLHDLAGNTHPDVFLPAYEHAYDALLSTSLPRFLAYAEENINVEKKLYWWLYGLLTSSIGWAIVIGCLFIDYWSDKTEGRKRAWRLFGVPFLTLGAMQMYAAYRGFCTQVWGRGTMQLRPWELAFPPATSEDLSPPATATSYEKRSHRTSLGSVGSLRKGVVDVFEYPAVPPAVLEEQRDASGDITELDRAPRLSPPAVLGADGYRDTWDAPTFAPTLSPTLLPDVERALPAPAHAPHDTPYATAPATLGARARVFGPERVVLDPRIRAVHRRVLRDIILFGLVAGTALTAVVLVLPHAR